MPRTSIFYYPLFIIAIFSIYPVLKQVNIKRLWKSALFVAGIFGVLHIIRCYNLKSSYEWWYDADNKNVLYLIKEDTKETRGPITFKCNWLFQPSMTYYTFIEKQNRITPPPYNKFIDSSEVVDYYLITSDDLSPWIKEHYDIMKSYSWQTRFLMKKKPLN